MATNNYKAIQQLYVAYFNRPADYFGLQYWNQVVDAAHGDTSAVSAAFAASAEYKASYGNLPMSAVVGGIYQNLFGHDGDLPGLDFWTAQLNAKVITIDRAVTAIAAGAQGSDLTTYNNRVTVAGAFTAVLGSSSYALAYSGDSANHGAKDFLAGITTDASMTVALDPATFHTSILAALNSYWAHEPIFNSSLPFANPTGILGAAISVGLNDYQALLDTATSKGTGVVSWFQADGDTYVVEDVSPSTAFVAGTDLVVKLTGLVDLSNVAVANGGHALTIV